MFPITKLPLELRLHIYPHMDLQLSPLERAQPAIMDAVANTSLYAEILPFCHAQNKVITNEEQATFKKVPLKEILKIRSLKLVFPADRGYVSSLFFLFFTTRLRQQHLGKKRANQVDN
jgi:hypothetical protein